MEKEWYANRKTLSKALYEFLWDSERLELLPGCGWNDGGCRSLMKAFQLWLGKKQVETYQIIKNRKDRHSEHALIKLGDFYLDGNGISTHNRLYKIWKYEEGFNKVIIRPFCPEGEPDCINGDEPFYIEDYKIMELVQMLEETFHKDNLISLLTNSTSK